MRLSFNVNFHTHSCLSPCADDEMTPMNIAGMASLGGYNVFALTDHNSAKNCPAFFVAARSYGIIPIAGMELTTSEDIHAVCLFPTLDGAMAFDRELDRLRVRIENRPDIFGRQLIMGKGDEVVGEEKYLLTNATLISIEELPSLVESFDGVCYPAHVDKDANGIIAILGTFPETPDFLNFEMRDPSRLCEFEGKYGLRNKNMIFGLDAHFLDEIVDAEHSVTLDTDGTEEDTVRALFEFLRG